MRRRGLLQAIAAAALLPVSLFAGADNLSLVNTVNLPVQFSLSNCNFNPQGLGVDEGASELLFMQQCSHPIQRTDLAGSYLGSVSVDQNHITDVAADGSYYYFSDYTGNSSTVDLHRMPKAGPPSAAISAEVAAYGGYPIDVRAGQIYRTEPSTTYDWSDLNQLRVANVATPDTILQTLTLSGLTGMGDFAVDLDGGNLWVLDWGDGRIHRYDLQTGGAPLQSFNLGLDGQTAGLTYYNDRLYHYDWVNGSGSTLRIYDIARSAIVVAAPVTVPATGNGTLAAVAALLALVGLRRLRRTAR